MGFFSRFSRSSSREHAGQFYLSLDIGTEVVKALIFQIDPEAKQGIVVGSARVMQAPDNMQSGAISSIAGVVETSRQAIQQAQDMAGVGHIADCVIGIAGELVKGTTTTVHYERPEPHEKIDLPELKGIVQKVQWKAYERIKEQITWELGEEVDVRLINAAIVDVRIDGYKITNPLNFKGKKVSIGIFNAYAPMIHLEAIHTIADDLQLRIMSVAAEPYAVSSSVGHENIADFGGIFIDIGGGTTDVAVVRNGGLEGTKMFAIGGRAFTKRLAYELGVSSHDAESLKQQYSLGQLSPEQRDRIHKIVAQDAQVWLSGVELSLAEFAENDLLPSNIFLCGGGSALPELQAALSDTAWTKNLPFAKQLQVSFLQPRDIVTMDDQTKTLKSPQDVTPLALANLAVNVVDEERDLAMILKRAMRSIQE